MRSLGRLLGFVAAATLVAAGGWLLMRTGVYGLSLFVILPVVLGALVECFWKSATGEGAPGVGASALLLANLALLAFGTEGAICIAMSIPLTVPLGAIGACWAHSARSSLASSHGTATLLLLLPLSAGTLGFDLTAKPPVLEVHTPIEIAAPPEIVWKHVISFSEIPPPREWLFKAGLAYPERARIVGSGVGAVRYCEFSTGPFVEPIKIWDEPRLLQFSVTENPAPMRELSPYRDLAPQHLHGYMVSEQGQFLLTPLANGHTLLEGTTWYRHGLWPSAYWRLWSDAIIHRIHLRVLNHIRTLAENDPHGPR